MSNQIAEDYLQQAWRLYESADFDDAEATFTKALRLEPQNGSAHFGRGMARAGLGDFAGALADYDAAIRLNPQDMKSYLYRGFAHEQSGDAEAATADYTDALRLDPENGGIYYHRALLRDRQGDAAAAIADYSEAIRCGGDYTPDSYFRRGSERFRLGDFDGAIADFGVSLHDVEGNFVVGSLLGLARSYEALKRETEALRCYRDYLQRSAPYADSAIVQHAAELEQRLGGE